MLRKIWFPTLVLALSCAVAFSQAAKPATLTVDEIVNKNIQAMGGLDNMRAIKTVKMTGKVTLGPGIEAPATIQQKRPNMVRNEFTLQGKTFIQAYDGTTAWQVNPFEGSPDPQKADEEDARDLQEQADMDGPLVDYKTKGNTVELVGQEDLEGTNVYKLKLTLKNGDVEYLYIDSQNFLALKSTSKRKRQGGEIEIESYFGDFKTVNNVMFPYSIENKVAGRTVFQIAVDSIQANIPIDDAVFKMPAAKPATRTN
ncbi:MAG TPA: hypothetical protein VK619_14880 [Pyrinomonadaceae bacterium]|nr:hypothetical protein [Pyrinomonadaceae bacterium]